jgi:tripartite-type tricarboxylate transporter receptor subunit TctC
MAKPFAALFLTCLFVISVGSARAASVEDFYKNRTIQFIVGGSAGGGYDTYTRLIGRHIAKYITGNPAVVVQNMPGAGMLIAANHVSNSAARDGTVIGNWSGPLILQHMMGNPAVKFDGRKLGWVGMPTADALICLTTEKSGVRSVDDWRKSKTRLKFGGNGPGTSGTDDTKILAAVADFPVQVIEGYKGTADVRIAAETGELDGSCTLSWQSAKVTWANALKTKQVHVVLQMSQESHPDLKGVPLAIDYAKSDEGKRLLRLASDLYGRQRVYSLPPQVPAERVRTLQSAFVSALKDPQLLAEAQKANLDIAPIDGPGIEKMVQGLYELEPAVVSRVKQILEGK